MTRRELPALDPDPELHLSRRAILRIEAEMETVSVEHLDVDDARLAIHRQQLVEAAVLVRAEHYRSIEQFSFGICVSPPWLAGFGEDVPYADSQSRRRRMGVDRRRDREAADQQP